MTETHCQKCKADIHPAYQGMSAALCEDCYSDHAYHFALQGSASVRGLSSNCFIVTDETRKVEPC